jgi:hypothetical protein
MLIENFEKLAREAYADPNVIPTPTIFVSYNYANGKFHCCPIGAIYHKCSPGVYISGMSNTLSYLESKYGLSGGQAAAFMWGFDKCRLQYTGNYQDWLALGTKLREEFVS